VRFYDWEVHSKCEEDFLLKPGWVLMITNSHHKRRELLEAHDEKTR
jgi:hypothetical protein